MKIFLTDLTILVLLVANLHAKTPLSSQLQFKRVFDNLTFSAPVDLQNAADGSGRLFVVEQLGTIRVIHKDKDTFAASTFLDITDRVKKRHNEMGLLGLAFHPDFKNNGFFFVNYTAMNPQRTVISRFQVDPQNKNKALPKSESLVLEFEQPWKNHNGGSLAFGPDGFLYIGVGDGGWANDRGDNGQNLGTLLGTILRLDIDKLHKDRNYSIPKDNPFVNTPGARKEIYACGLRNPWRMHFDKKTGKLFTGDIGQNAWEEVDEIVKGGNYGWPIKEGLVDCRPDVKACTDTLIKPRAVYSLAKDGRSVIAGVVPWNDDLKAFHGHLIYCDYYSGKVWKLPVKEGDAQMLEVRAPGRVSSFGMGEDGAVYACDHLNGGLYILTTGKP